MFLSCREIFHLSAQTLEELEAALESYFKFIVVRHPFDRLLSAYRDRLTSTGKYSHQAWVHVPRIIRFLRPAATLQEVSRHNLFYKNKTVRIAPSFQEFIHYLLLKKPGNMDIHWVPYWTQCNPCSIHYDAVVKLETVLDDQEYINQKTGMQEVINLETLHKTNGGSTKDHRKEFFSEVPCEVLIELYKLYYADFILFGYTIAEFLDICDNDT